MFYVKTSANLERYAAVAVLVHDVEHHPDEHRVGFHAQRGRKLGFRQRCPHHHLYLIHTKTRVNISGQFVIVFRAGMAHWPTKQLPMASTSYWLYSEPQFSDRHGQNVIQTNLTIHIFISPINNHTKDLIPNLFR